MARAKYDPLKSNRSSFGKRPKLTWSDKRSGDSVGKGLKRGSYQAWTAYHHPKHSKSLFTVKPARKARVTRTKVKPTRQTLVVKETPRDTVPTTSSVIYEVSTPVGSQATTSVFAGSRVLPPRTLEALREYFHKLESLQDDEESISEPDDEGPLFGNDKPRNVDHCPYCGFIFPKVPKRGRACEKCGQKFVVRSNCVLYNSIFLTLEESAANDCFPCVSHINTPIKFAKQALLENPNFSPRELFIKMVESYSADTPKNWLKDCGSTDSSMYQAIARYEEQCGRDGSAFHKLAKTKAKEFEIFWKAREKVFEGKIDIWK